MSEQMEHWSTALNCPVCKANMELAAGFERIKLDGEEEFYGQEVEQVQCEACLTEFGLVNFDTKEVIEDWRRKR